jgi:hypothetical protein
MLLLADHQFEFVTFLLNIAFSDDIAVYFGDDLLDDFYISRGSQTKGGRCEYYKPANHVSDAPFYQAFSRQLSAISKYSGSLPFHCAMAGDG